MIDEKKLLDVLCELGEKTQKNIKTAEKDPNHAWFESALKNQLVMLHKTIEIVKEQPKICDWISCNDYLPEEKTNPITQDFYEYQVTYRSGDITDVRHYKFGNGHWWNDGEIMDKYVAAWRNPVEPYHP